MRNTFCVYIGANQSSETINKTSLMDWVATIDALVKESKVNSCKALATHFGNTLMTADHMNLSDTIL